MLRLWDIITAFSVGHTLGAHHQLVLNSPFSIFATFVFGLNLFVWLACLIERDVED